MPGATHQAAQVQDGGLVGAALHGVAARPDELVEQRRVERAREPLSDQRGGEQELEAADGTPEGVVALDVHAGVADEVAV